MIEKSLKKLHLNLKKVPPRSFENVAESIKTIFIKKPQITFFGYHILQPVLKSKDSTFSLTFQKIAQKPYSIIDIIVFYNQDLTLSLSVIQSRYTPPLQWPRRARNLQFQAPHPLIFADFLIFSHFAQTPTSIKPSLSHTYHRKKERESYF